jgi:hypothetical protein
VVDMVIVRGVFKMGLSCDPKIVFCAKSQDYRHSSC